MSSRRSNSRSLHALRQATRARGENADETKGFALRLDGGAPLLALAEAALPDDVVEMVRQQCIRMRFNLEKLVTDYAVSEHTIQVEFSPSLNFNASCGARAEGDTVSLNAGIYVWSYVISCMIDASAHDAAIREAYEASSFLLDMREYEGVDSDVLRTVLEDYSNFFAGSKSAGDVLSYITDCIWLHEIAHSLLGHAEYVAKAYRRADTSLQERPEPRRRRAFPPAYVTERRFMEWEADRFAGALAALLVAERGETAGDAVEQQLALHLYGYAILVSAFAAANDATPGADLYPSPLCRFLSFQLGMNVKGGEIGLDLSNLFEGETLSRSVQLCFEMLSELGKIFPAVSVFGRFTDADFKEAIVDEYVAIAASTVVSDRLSPFRKFNIVMHPVA